MPLADVLELFAPWGPGWLIGALLVLVVAWAARELIGEYREQNERRAELDLAREGRKRDEQEERARRDRERSEMEGRIAAQMERSNSLMEGMKALMESVLTSNEALHEDFRQSRDGSQAMAADVAHVRDRVDLLYAKESRDKE